MSEAIENSNFFKCGCGKPVRYIVGQDDNGNPIESCNKYMRCQTREEMQLTLECANKKIAELEKENEFNGKGWFDRNESLKARIAELEGRLEAGQKSTALECVTITEDCYNKATWNAHRNAIKKVTQAIKEIFNL